MKEPIAYLRKSRVTNDRHVSWEMQENAIREMAGGDITLLSDWNKSGGTSARPGYQSLIAAIEAGTVSTVYSYSLSRLSRSLSDFSSLVELCEKHGVAIKLHSERHLDFDTASGRLMVNILAAFAQMERELARERARDTVAVRRARGDKIGPAFFDRTDLVLAAYREAGSFNGAARLLSERNVPTRNGNPYWHGTVVKDIVSRVAPAEVPRRMARGAKSAAPFLFHRLLLCHYCGKPLTGVRYHHGRGLYTRYVCARSRYTEKHGHTSVPETAVKAWAREELALLLPLDERVAAGDDALGQRNALRERRERLWRAFVDGLVPEADYDLERAAMDKHEDELDAAGRIVAVGEIDLDAEEETVITNRILRALWEGVETDARLRPVRARRIDAQLWRQPTR